MDKGSKIRYFDPLYGATYLSDFESGLVRTSEFQRLRYVRLCNINSMLITGASEISRYEHCLGVLRLVKEWISVRSVDEREAESLTAACVFHDVQTGPFGHSLQYIVEDNDSVVGFVHEDVAHGLKNKYHQGLSANTAFAGVPFSAHKILGDRWEAVTSLIKGNGVRGALVSGTLDLDNLDNVIRLAYHVGIATSEDARLALELARDMEPSTGALEVSRASVAKVLRWQEIRRRLYELLLLDWAEFSAKAMLSHAVELAISAELLDGSSWAFTDDELIGYLEHEGKGEFQELGNLARRLRVGDLYEPVLLTRSDNVEAYKRLSTIQAKRHLEDKLHAMLREKHLSVSRPIVHYILDLKKTSRAIAVRVREDGSEARLGLDSSSLLIGIFVSRAISMHQRNEVDTVCRSVLADAGVTDLRVLDDPVAQSAGSTSNAQLGLFDA